MINISLLNYFNKYLGAVFNERLKQAKLATNNDFNTVEQKQKNYKHLI